LNRFITVTERARKSEGNIERFLKNLIGHVLALFSLAPSGPLPGDGRGYKGLDDRQDGSRHRETSALFVSIHESGGKFENGMRRNKYHAETLLS